MRGSVRLGLQSRKRGSPLRAFDSRDDSFTHVWRVRARLPERYGKRCRVLVTARRMNSVLVEFEDGYRVVTSRNYIRLLRETPLFDAGIV